MLESLKCKSGAYVEIVPIGLLCTLQYNSNGILQRIIKGFNSVDSDAVDVFEPELTIQLKEADMIPQRIQFTKGTTWIKGVFYTSTIFKANGLLPDCVQNAIFDTLKSRMSDFKFYAADLSNDSYNFVTSNTIVTRLVTFGFQTLPGYPVFDELEYLPVEEVMRQRKSPFKFPFISGMFIFESMNPSRYLPAGLIMDQVTSTDEYLDKHGYLRSVISYNEGKTDVSYADVANFNLIKKSVVILDGDKIIYSQKPAALFYSNVISREIKCSICGKKIIVPRYGHTFCADVHCPSRMYPRLVHFLSVLHLPDMKFNTFTALITTKKVTCLLDIFDLPKYKDCKIDCTLSDLLFAVVPFEISRGKDFFQKFVNYLGSIEALDYYLENPESIVSDLDLNKMYARNFVDWLKDPANLLELTTLLQMKDRVTIRPVKQKFVGAPIFRGKTICVTGRFQHGTLEDIISILRSYSAKVVTTFDNTVNWVVLGQYEEEDANITNLAMSYNVPIYSEKDFFFAYDIDGDIRMQNLANPQLP